MALKDYSQNGEQDAILKYAAYIDGNPESINPLPDYVSGLRFLDIGAWDPFVFSNTRALYEIGWRGVVIEPSPAPLRKLVKEYGNDITMKVVGAAVGVNPGLSNMAITDDAVSTGSLDVHQRWTEHAEYIGWLQVPTLTLDHILTMFGKFEFVNIDAEGCSVDLLKVLLSTEMFPRCIACEHDDRLVEAQSAAQARGYKVVFTNQANVIFAL